MYVFIKNSSPLHVNQHSDHQGRYSPTCPTKVNNPSRPWHIAEKMAHLCSLDGRMEDETSIFWRVTLW